MYGFPSSGTHPVHPASMEQDSAIEHIIEDSVRSGDVMRLAAHLSDDIGARVPNSPASREAARWAQLQFAKWGLSNVHAEKFDFGRGWWIEGWSVGMKQPRELQLRGIPIAWTPPTRGPVDGKVIVAPMSKVGDFQRWRGQLRGKIVLVSAARPPSDQIAPSFVRFSSADLLASDSSFTRSDTGNASDDVNAYLFFERLDHFLTSEGAVAWLRMSRRDNGIVHGNLDSPGFLPGRTPNLPGFEISAEDYRRLVRLSASKDVSLELESRVHYDDTEWQAANVIADLPGKRPDGEYVMVGAHLDSWAAGDGASDDGAGVAAIMEAARLLKQSGVRPRRTIRFVLWGVEEPGFYGSYAYIDRHIAALCRPSDRDARALWPISADAATPFRQLPGSSKIVAYFNIDNGAGRIRGIYGKEYPGVAPLLTKWLRPLVTLGASSLVPRSPDSSDNIPFARVGVPSFAFVQDDLDQTALVNHSNLDTFDHLRAGDLRQAAAVVAAVLLSAANSPEKPRRGGRPAGADRCAKAGARELEAGHTASASSMLEPNP